MMKLICAALMAASVLIAGTVHAEEKPPLRLAFIDPLSGAFAANPINALAQIRFDVARINKEGGINGHKVEVVAFDNNMDPQKSLTDLNKAINDGIHYVIQGSSSAVASALLNAINKHNERSPDSRVLYLNRVAQDPAFTNERCSFWHFRFDDNTAMKVKLLTSWIEHKNDMKKVFLINQDYSYGHAVSEAARKMLKEKRPDIEIVGDSYVPISKVKDFTPYVIKIKASGADVVITSNWGQDMTLLTKAASSAGLNTPFLTLYGNAPGMVEAVGKKGVGSIYAMSDLSGDFDNPEMAERRVAMYQQTGQELTYVRISDMMMLLKMAMEKADSIDPTKVAFALEGLQYDSPTGRVVMRASDHQIQLPMFMSVLSDNMKHGIGDTGLNFHAIEKFSAQDGEMPTTCHMKRPKHP